MINIPRKEAFQTKENEFSILSWNLLAPNLNRENKMSWSEERFPLILEELRNSNADILCLQEMQQDCMERDFVPELVEKNAGRYQGLRCCKSDVGVATFWNSDKFELMHSVSKNRSMIVILKEKLFVATTNEEESEDDSRMLAVVNVHLDDNPFRVFTRVQQLQSVMKELERLSTNITATVLCGDFSCPQRQSACTSYLKGDEPLDAVMENNQVFDLTSCIRPNPLRFIPSYPFAELPSSQYFTYAGRQPGCYAAGIDQLWFSRKGLKTKKFREICASEEQRCAILNEGLPSQWNPSDHMPIGAIIEWQEASDLVDCRDDSNISCNRLIDTKNTLNDSNYVEQKCSKHLKEEKQGFLQNASTSGQIFIESYLCLHLSFFTNNDETSKTSSDVKEKNLKTIRHWKRKNSETNDTFKNDSVSYFINWFYSIYEDLGYLISINECQ